MSLEKLNLDGIISAAAKANPRVPGDFMQDGLLYCGKCKTPKQCRVTVCGEEHTVPCMCDCREQAKKRFMSPLSARLGLWMLLCALCASTRTI